VFYFYIYFKVVMAHSKLVYAYFNPIKDGLFEGSPRMGIIPRKMIILYMTKI